MARIDADFISFYARRPAWPAGIFFKRGIQADRTRSSGTVSL
jgi:hypothetical protein